MYAILRGDIYMPIGKAIAQASHAFLDCYMKALLIRPEIAKLYLEKSHGTKVTLKAKSLYQLLKTHDELVDCGICVVLVTDSNHICLPDFNGSPIITALGIGPITREQSGRILKKYNCY